MSDLGPTIGIVTSNKDEQRMGRVRVRLPALGNVVTDWIRVAVPMAGDNRGTFFMPQVDDEVLLVFLNGDPNFPLVIGALWNGTDAAPVDNGNGENNVRMIRSRSGHRVIFDDTKNSETLTFVDSSGRNSVVIQTKDDTITITSGKNIKLAAPNGAIELTAQTLTLKASGTAELAATGDLTLSGDHVDIN